MAMRLPPVRTATPRLWLDGSCISARSRCTSVTSSGRYDCRGCAKQTISTGRRLYWLRPIGCRTALGGASLDSGDAPPILSTPDCGRRADVFSALSRGHDTVGTLRHNANSSPRVSLSVHSVTSPPGGKGAAEGRAEYGVDCNRRESAPSWSNVEEKRAAIVERDGGIPREWSEGSARPHPDHPPPGVLPKRW